MNKINRIIPIYVFGSVFSSKKKKKKKKKIKKNSWFITEIN